MWQIELEAPQYPEGLVLKLHTNKIGGDVEIINGLNHYIGMKTLHAADFVEFTVLPYLIVFFALFAFAVALMNRYKWLGVLFVSFALFCVLAMADFWEPKIRSEFYEPAYDSWSESPAHLADAMDDCEPLAWAVHSIYTEVRDEIQSALDEMSETSGVFKKRAAALKARLKAMPEEPNNGVADWLLALTAGEF